MKISHRAGALFLAIATSLTVAAPQLHAQDTRNPHDAQPERPTVATHAGTVAPGWFEIETGVERDHVAPGISSLATPTLLKFGVAPRVQFDVTLTTVQPSSSQSTGVGDGGIGLKWRLAEGLPVLGDFAIQPSVKFPTGSVNRGTGTGTTDGSLLLISSHVIGPVALDVNTGMTRRGDGTNAGLWTVSTGTTINGPFAWAAELFGSPGLSGARPSAGFLTGPTYAVHAWFVVDAGVILNVAGSQSPAAYAGLTWNVGRFP
jgi:hypothetical protein